MNIEEIKKAIENNSNYWEKRALENKLSAIENEEDYLRRISSIYDHANKQIDEKLAKVYARYAKENNLTLEEAYKQLPKKMETEYKKDVMDYVNKAKDPSYKQYLLNQSIMHKHSVLDQLRTEMRNVIYDIDMEETGGKFLEKIFTDSNYRAQYSNNEEAFAKVDKEKIQNLLKENWSGGGNFSELIWKGREKLVKALDDIVMKGLATGDNYDKMSDKLAKRMDTSKSNAKRLIMTESARMENEGLLSYYQRIGAKQLIFVATLDMRTSEICRAMDGQIIPIEEAKIGLNVPPLHPYCRSVISPHYEGNEPGDRVYRDVETGKTKSGRYRTYKEYLEEELRDKKQAEALASYRNDLQTLIMAVGSVPIKAASNQTVVEDKIKIDNSNATHELIEYKKIEIERGPYDTKATITEGEKEYNNLVEESDKLFNTLPDDQLKALEDYIGSEYKTINELSRAGKDNSTIKSLEKAINQFKIKDDIIVYRGTNGKYYDNLKQNSEFTSNMFYSTSLNEGWARSFAIDVDTVLEIKVPKKSSGFYIGNHSGRNEYELLLNRNTKFKVIGSRIEKGVGIGGIDLRYIELEIVN